MTTNHSMGYLLIGSRLEHVLVAERALGKSLPDGAEIHHFDENKKNNVPENLVICPNRAYHMLLHMRQKALAACGDASKRKCTYCKTWDSINRMAVRERGPRGNEYRHRACHANAQALRKRKQKESLLND